MQKGASIEAGIPAAGRTEPWNEAEFELLFRLHQRMVRGWILRMVRNPQAADELTVETFWRIYCARARFDAAREFEPWVRRIATRIALDWLRAERPEQAVPEEFLARRPAADAGDPAIAEEIRRKVRDAWMRLPVKLRATTLLAVVEERPQKEVAQALGISIGAVKVRVFRALRLLRKELKRQGITP